MAEMKTQMLIACHITGDVKIRLGRAQCRGQRTCSRLVSPMKRESASVTRTKPLMPAMSAFSGKRKSQERRNWTEEGLSTGYPTKLVTFPRRDECPMTKKLRKINLNHPVGRAKCDEVKGRSCKAHLRKSPNADRCSLCLACATAMAADNLSEGMCCGDC